MPRSPDRATRSTRDAANVAAAAVVVYALLWALSTQATSIREISPFGDDPWDAFATYAAIFLPVVAGATWVRSLRNRDTVVAPATARRILWGSGLASAIVFVAAGVDLVPIATMGFPHDAGGFAVLLTALVIGSVATAAAALALAVRAARAGSAQSTTPPTEPDIVDDTLVLAVEVAAHVGLRRPVEAVASAIETFLERSPVSPRRHRWLFGLVLAVAAAIAFDLWHAVREGPWINLQVAVIFATLMAAGVLAVYLGTVEPLRLLRPPTYEDAPE
jgi:hypothetical protein